ncbi:hypothetical protein SK3146_04972 [Paenibacillus konkukensis]|uniref:Microcin J25-processing protein McjB C-terminal domain-containing protein n=1 Tax=Paenibacillus konkukensis TaxID=2020716 RepID=A0ABY4RU32_9BACL|nr:lasso peptide biosynthesis B2 protein [Paenibacillus konkukensis]UQZ85683.1 hypothetical protein SK3146_04972 [Paenibacillus konkukensis]
MGVIRKARNWLSLDWKTMLAFIEAYVYLGWARFLVSRPFAEITPSLGEAMEETPETSLPEQEGRLRVVYDAVQIMSRHTFWESKCLVRAIAALKMLERRRIESTLYLGTAKDEAGKLIAHAWLRSGPYYITGAEEMGRFRVVGKFAKRISDKGK